MSVWRAPARRLLELPPPRARVASSNEWLPMRDGVRLATRVVLPVSGAAARGTLLVRGADVVHAGRHALPWLASQLAEQGLAVVLQECRGLHASEGELAPFTQEADDGADTLAWLARQPWYAPPLSLAGARYAGYAAWAALAASPLPVARFVVAYAARDPHAWLHAGGALRLESAFALAFGLAAAERGSAGVPDLARALRHRPLREADRVGMRRLDWLREWLAHPERDDFWQSLCPALPAVAPERVLLLARWGDASLPAQRADHAALAAAGAASTTLEIRPALEQRARDRIEQLRTLRRVADFLLATPDARGSMLRCFDAGAGRWREPSAAPEGVAARRFHLRSAGGLGESPPAADEAPARFVYDPADATPCDAERGERGDVRVYVSEPLVAALELAGRVRAELYVASSAPATDFSVDLWAQDASGASHPIGFGVTRCAWDAADPERVRRIEVECDAACFTLAAGSRLRVEVASASQPRFDRSSNTPAHPMDATPDVGVPALQTVFHDAARPSCLILEARA